METTNDIERVVRTRLRSLRQALGLSLDDVVEATEAGSQVSTGAYIESGDQQFILRGLGQASTLGDLRRTVIRSTSGVPVDELMSRI